MSRRTEQVESTLQRAISQVLQRRLADPRIQGLISVTRVKVSPDLHSATVGVSVLPQEKQALVIRALRHAAGHIHALVRREVSMKVVPRLEFELDESLKKQAGVYGAIQRGVERTGPAHSEGGEDQIPPAPQADTTSSSTPPEDAVP